MPELRIKLSCLLRPYFLLRLNHIGFYTLPPLALCMCRAFSSQRSSMRGGWLFLTNTIPQATQCLAETVLAFVDRDDSAHELSTLLQKRVRPHSSFASADAYA